MAVFDYYDLFVTAGASAVVGIAAGFGAGAWVGRTERLIAPADRVQPPDRAACGQVCALASLPRDTDVLLRPRRRRTPPGAAGGTGELFTHRA